MKIQVAKRYVLANGMITGEMMRQYEQDGARFYTRETVNGFRPAWFPNGRADFFEISKMNEPYHIIKEYEE